MRASLLLSLFIALPVFGRAIAAAAGPDTQPTTRPIRQVRSLDDLRRIEPIEVDGWKVRLGWSEGGQPPQPWKLIWCLGSPARPKGAAEVGGNFRGKPLGPVRLYVSTSPKGDLASGSEILAKRRLVRKFAEALYCRSFVAAPKGTYYVNISSRAGTLLARQTLKVEKDQPHYWHAAVEEREEGDQRYFRILGRAKPAYPTFQGLQPVWQRPQDRQVKELKAPKGKALRLPGLVPPMPLWQDPTKPLKSVAVGQKQVHDLALSLKGRTLILKPAVPIDGFLPDHLLARWWVNGKPMAAPAQARLSELARTAVLKPDDKPIPIRLVLPDSLGALKVSDKVAVQMMYSPGGWMVPGTGARLAMNLSAQGPRCPLLSDRLEFKVTQAMLAGRADRRK